MTVLTTPAAPAPVVDLSEVVPLVVSVPSMDAKRAGEGTAYITTAQDCTCPARQFHAPERCKAGCTEDAPCACKHMRAMPDLGEAQSVFLPRLKGAIRPGSVVMLTEERGRHLSAGVIVADFTVSLTTGRITVLVTSESGHLHQVAIADIEHIVAF